MKKKILFIITILIICAGVWFYFTRNNLTINDNVTKTERDNINIVSIATSSANAVVSERKVEIKKEEIKQIKKSTPTAPDLNREIKITAEMSDEAKKITVDKIIEISNKLKQNPDSLEDWLLLGIYRKMAGDYEGAGLCWEYAGAVRPQNSTSFQNLGELYAYYLKDNQKAEQNYKKAIENGPEQIYIYRNFADFYRYVLKDTAKAKAILEQGIIANPGATSLDLQNLLKSL